MVMAHKYTKQTAAPKTEAATISAAMRWHEYFWTTLARFCLFHNIPVTASAVRPAYNNIATRVDDDAMSVSGQTGCLQPASGSHS
jgi:hypothetical protein